VTVTTGADVSTHPAVRAWLALGARSLPTEVERFKAKKTSAVYRLVGADHGANVVAKRRSIESAQGLRIERTVYDEVLPGMPGTSLRCLGMVEDDGDGSTWLFIEDGGPRYYSPDSAAERRALGSWLGALHTEGTAAAQGADLPDRGPAPFRGYLADGRATIIEHRGNPALDEGEHRILLELLHLIDLVDSRWDELSAFCAAMPRVLVHGDLIARNVCLRIEAGTTHVLTIDWEKAGWGIPSTDLAQAPIPSPQFAADAEIDAYRAAVRHVWPHLDREALEHSAWYATIFRCLIAIHWDAPYLRVDWPHRTMAKMEYYRSALALACGRVGWGGL
jgi:hypothetical protein